MANESLKINNARFLITVDPERRIIRDGAIVTDGQRITHVGKASALTSVHADRVIDATEMVASSTGRSTLLPTAVPIAAARSL